MCSREKTICSWKARLYGPARENLVIFASRASSAGPVRPGRPSRPGRPARSGPCPANSSYVYPKEKFHLLANDKAVPEYVLEFRSGNDLLFWYALVPQTVDVNFT